MIPLRPISLLNSAKQIRPKTKNNIVSAICDLRHKISNANVQNS